MSNSVLERRISDAENLAEEDINSKKDNLILEVSTINNDLWYKILERFSDASLFQTIAYGNHQVGGKKLEHVLFRRNGKIVAAAQVRTMIVKGLNRGIAYIYRGPLWQLKNTSGAEGLLGEALKLLNEEYVVKRNLMLRIVPCIPEEEKELYEPLFRSAGFSINPEKKKDKTILLDIELNLAQLRKNFRSNWRRNLQNSEKHSLEVIKGSEDKYFTMFQGLYGELMTMKVLPYPADMSSFRKIQNELPEGHKMQVFICLSEGRPVAGLVIAAGSIMGLLLFSATNNEGKKLHATTLLHWHVINWLKDKGCKTYDLGGIDAESNPGCYRFKTGFGGREVSFTGQYESCRSISSRILVNTGEFLKKIKHKVRQSAAVISRRAVLL